MAEPASWIWIPVVLWAALAQTVRNTAQRSLTGSAGMLGATLARFLYGVPFALAATVLVQLLWGEALRLPPFNAVYLGWLAAGAATQVAATSLLLAAMKHGNFTVSVTYSKTEVLQVAFFAALLLHEVPSALSLAGMVLAVVGVVLLMRAKVGPAVGRERPAGADPLAGAGTSAVGAVGAERVGAEPRARTWGGFGPAALFGLGAGACFALTAIGYRAAGLELMAVSGAPAWHVSTWSVLLAQIMQSVGVMGWLALRDPRALGAVFSGWRMSLTAGLAGALASLGWFLAYALQQSANVRAVGMVEVVFSYIVSHRLLGERFVPQEMAGLLIVVLGAIGVCLGSG